MSGYAHVRKGSTGVLMAPKRDFRSTPKNRHEATAAACQFGATKRRKSRKIRDSEVDISRPGNKKVAAARTK